MKSRKQNIDELTAAIAKSKRTILATKAALAVQEDRLERQRATLGYHVMMTKFDHVDNLRQHVSDLVAQSKWESDAGHVDELESDENHPSA